MRAHRPETKSETRTRPRFGMGAAIVLVIVVLVIAVLISALAPRGSTQLLPAGALPSSSGALGVAAGQSGPVGVDSVGPIIFVHVLGKVERPGLYELQQGDRVVDALAAAGGFTETADREQQNLARLISDGEQLRVPALGELPPAGSPSSSGTGLTASGLVNINTADAAALETLPRVGPATAQKILDYREANGPFTQVDDLLGVPGIGEATLAGLQDQVTV